MSAKPAIPTLIPGVGIITEMEDIVPHVLRQVLSTPGKSSTLFDGTVFSFKNLESQYGSCLLYTSGQYRVHQLIALAFIPNPFKQKIVNHKNGIKTDNRVANLEWCSIYENNVHAIKMCIRDRSIRFC